MIIKTDSFSLQSIAAGVLALVVAPGRAGTVMWNDPAGGLFSDPLNWQTGVPTTSDLALFDLSGTYSVQFDQSTATSDLVVRQGDVTFDLGGFTYSLSTAVGDHIRVADASREIATLRINHGALSDRGVRIGVGGAGTLIVSGVDAQLDVTNSINVGYTSNGTLIVENGGKVTDANGLLGLTTNGFATVTGAGSQWINTTFLNVGGPGSAFTGSLNIANGGLVSSPSTDILTSGRIIGNGTIQGAVSNRGGAVAPGGSLATAALTIDGDYTQASASATASARLEIELGGTTPGATANGFDVLHVTGAASLARSFTVTLINGFTPGNGAHFDVLAANSVSGAFVFVNMPTLPNGSFTIQYLPDRVRLVAPGPAIEGDINHDGHVNIDDLLGVINSWGMCPAGPCPGDVNGSGAVDIDDLLAVITHWG